VSRVNVVKRGFLLWEEKETYFRKGVGRRKGGERGDCSTNKVGRVSKKGDVVKQKESSQGKQGQIKISLQNR